MYTVLIIRYCDAFNARAFLEKQRARFKNYDTILDVVIIRINQLQVIAYFTDLFQQGIPFLLGNEKSAFMRLVNFDDQGNLVIDNMDFSINNTLEYKAERFAELDTEELRNNIAKFKLLQLVGEG